MAVGDGEDADANEALRLAMTRRWRRLLPRAEWGRRGGGADAAVSCAPLSAEPRCLCGLARWMDVGEKVLKDVGTQILNARNSTRGKNCLEQNGRTEDRKKRKNG